MFGGYNVSLFGLTFGLIANDTLYLKVDEETVESFRAHGLGPFVFKTKDGKEMTMSYFAAPDALDDWEAIGPWVRGALAAAQRAKAPRGKGTGAKKAPARRS
jgi:DNA transformation protein